MARAVIWKKWGKAKRLRSKSQLRHRPNGHGKGRWHSLSAFWKSKRKGRVRRKMADASRRANRGL